MATRREARRRGLGLAREGSEDLAHEARRGARRRASLDKMLGEVEGAARMLAQNARMRATLRAVSSTIHGIATDDERPAAIRARAAEVMQGLRRPDAARADRRAAPRARRRASRGGAHARPRRRRRRRVCALRRAREGRAEREPLASRSSTTMRALGESSWPVVRAALERIPAAALTGGHPLAAALAEDLLLCVPTLRDEAAGHLVAKYVRTTEAALCRAATQALGRLWAERAAPLLLALLDVKDDGVRAAAIAGLREIGAVDEHVVPSPRFRSSRGKVEAGHELRLAAVAALEFVTADARPVAVPLLVQLVRDPAPTIATVLAASRALISVMGNEARVGVARSLGLARPSR